MNTRAVVKLMRSSNSEAEWNKNCDQVKAAFDGGYPDFWFDAIVLSGVMDETAAKWDGPSAVEVLNVSH